MNNISILFLIFNRPSETRRVFEAIRLARPTTLFIAADGPRADYPDEKRLCEEAQSVVSEIDWPCKIKTRFQETNLGCKTHVSSAITWFFENIEEGIILEDDCLPDQSFFTFAGAMLDKYRDNEKVMHVSGTNFQFGRSRGNGIPSPSYYFSRCVHIWGWATWRRAWLTYDIEMKDLEAYANSKKIYSLFKNKKVAKFWISLFRHIKKKNVDTWDAQWAYAVMKSDGLAVTPNMNLVENIGFGAASTHTGNAEDIKRQSAETLSNIVYPTSLCVDKDADDFLTKTLYIEPVWFKLLRRFKLR